jgi:hypothetical protein
MGIGRIFSTIFGGGRNIVSETIGVFRLHAERTADRESKIRGEAMNQFGTEFLARRQGWFDSFVNGMNRLPRPLITYTVFGLFLMVIIDPLQFAATMQALTLVPAQLWELLSVIVMFFFGARELSHFRSDSMAKEAARITAAVPVVMENMHKILHSRTPGVADIDNDSDTASEPNPAVQDFYETRRN